MYTTIQGSTCEAYTILVCYVVLDIDIDVSCVKCFESYLLMSLETVRL